MEAARQWLLGSSGVLCCCLVADSLGKRLVARVDSSDIMQETVIDVDCRLNK